jgi:hypothetical protein
MNREEILELVIYLNQNEQMMNSFAEDPVKFIKQLGYTITPEQEKKLDSYVQDVQKSGGMQSMVKKCVLKSMIKNTPVAPPSMAMGGCGYGLCG